MAPKESEKKMMAEKVAKVREVVDNVTNNDIIMVLHSFDLDVNKTISAFLEDGASSILGGWVTSTGVSVTAAKKKKNKSKKPSESATPEAAPTAPVPTKSAPAPVVAAPASSSVNKSAAASKPVASTPAPTDALSAAFKSIRLALNEREKELKQSNSTKLDTSAILQAIASLGGSSKPITNGKPASTPAKQAVSPPPPAAGPIKHATSQSSITSSVGADSGVNLSPTHKEEKKAAPKTVINSGGVQLTSSGLSADQLAALQQTLQLTMAARGLDASLITSSENMPRRPKNNNNNKSSNDGKKGHKGAQKDQPKLSIL
ncbi:hypothetical protein GCK72_000867 [Caenorhabditis remanei]|uniref:Uncharacterized protein n=1 Tax=Caenorhabditis remanei TaxID=31234 RepID=E3N4R5_CAERE|nr:hypothetical protein GCK72_000867 [Caenorhabditis remanei]EFO86422.1 hypothetical protein CRE_01212 [Caenorhabditis remanei]KAF1769054.1 hypothetical protein GCK72_000867 [Caenorhabditis remanei]